MQNPMLAFDLLAIIEIRLDTGGGRCHICIQYNERVIPDMQTHPPLKVADIGFLV